MLFDLDMSIILLLDYSFVSLSRKCNQSHDLSSLANIYNLGGISISKRYLAISDK